MRPRDFANRVSHLARVVDFDSSRIILGGDHLGPNTWQDLPAAEAMQKARITSEKNDRQSTALAKLLSRNRRRKKIKSKIQLCGPESILLAG